MNAREEYVLKDLCKIVDKMQELSKYKIELLPIRRWPDATEDYCIIRVDGVIVFKIGMMTETGKKKDTLTGRTMIMGYQGACTVRLTATLVGLAVSKEGGLYRVSNLLVKKYDTFFEENLKTLPLTVLGTINNE